MSSKKKHKWLENPGVGKRAKISLCSKMLCERFLTDILSEVNCQICRKSIEKSRKGEIKYATKI